MTDVVLEAVPALPGLYRSAALGGVQRRLGLRKQQLVLPQVRHRVVDAPVDAERLTAFQHLTGHPARDSVPSAYVHTLAFPVAMSLMARADFPLPLPGMVHLSNTVLQTRALQAGERFEAVAYA